MGVHPEEIDEANRRALEIIKPSEQEVERGLRVHGEAIVFDFGLTRFGLKVLERLNGLRVLVNVSHCGRQTTLDACDASEAR